MKSHSYCLLAYILVTFALIFTGQALAGDIDAKLPDKDNTSSFQVKDSDSSVLMQVQSGGNVGIGTTGPWGKLHVKGAGESAIGIDTESSTAKTHFVLRRGGSDQWDIGHDKDGDGGHDLYFYDSVNGAFRIVIDNSGYVGIGTTNPRYKLDVIGDIRATGSVYYGGTSGGADGTAYTKPDYVFQEGYNKMSTEDVDGYLQKKGHLPWLTSQKREKEENREMVNMTRMAFETVETVENLQLQIIELSKIVKNQQSQIDHLLSLLNKRP